MAVLTATDFATQIVAQARVLDPSFSGEIGTPERKMIDAFAQALADNQVDLTGLAGALDIDSKYGANLSRFTALFAFQRQQAVAAKGYVNFTRTSPADDNITIPQATQLQANTPDRQGQYLQFVTTASGSIAQGATDSGAVPIACTVTGSGGNVAANTITQMVGQNVPGVTAVNNANALVNGADQENDNAYKTRFKNTWARNLAGTSAQYLALAVAGSFTTKANAIGAQSRFQEYVQIPDFDDNGGVDGVVTVVDSTYGLQNQWTTALSSIPYIKQVYTSTPSYVQDSSQDFFYRPGTDFQFNPSPLLMGDALRNAPTAIASTQTVTFPNATITVGSTAGFPSSGLLWFIDAQSPTQGRAYSYSGTTGTTFTGVNGVVGFSASYTLTAAEPVYLYPSGTLQPNFTFLNVTNSSTSGIDGLQALAPSDIVLTEFSYISTASRNDLNHAVTNAVDIYVNGANDSSGSCIFLPSNLGQFNVVPNDSWYVENFRRDGNSAARPYVGNYVTPLFNSPVDALPATIAINNQNYYLGTHYWLVHEIGQLGGSIRARDAIEWSATLGGDLSGTPPTNALSPYPTTGATISNVSSAGNLAVTVNNYLFDANVVTLQANMENARQIGTDVLVHKAATRYFKLDITVMYASNSNPAAVNASIAAAIQAFFDNQYFGAVIQLSDLLDIVHQVPGVDNVRWSNDLPIAPDAIRVLEVDINGNPLHGVTVGRSLQGTASVTEQHRLHIAGGFLQPTVSTQLYAALGTPDSFTLTWTDPGLPGGAVTTAAITFASLAASSANLQTAIRAAFTTAGVSTGPYHNIVVTQNAVRLTNVVNPIVSFGITYGAVGAVYVPTVANNIAQSAYAYDSDFLLLDNELPSVPANALTTDTVAGLIIRTRAQNTWLRPGLG